MIATNEAADVLRHGWQDAASTLAADIPEVGELLQARLEIAIASQRLDERHLLDTIEEVESISSRAGSPASDALALRLRRTVYEFLLALDATRPTENKASVEQRPVSDGPMVGAEEVAALGHSTHLRGSGAQAGATHSEEDDASASLPEVPTEEGDDASTAATGRRFGPRDKRHGLDTTTEEADAALAAEPAEAGTSDVADDAPAETGVAAEAASQDSAGDAEPGDPSATAFMAPKAGFHIGDDGIVVPAAGGGDDTPLTMPVFAADEPAADTPDDRSAAAPPAISGEAAADESSEFLTWHHATHDGEVEPPPAAEIAAPPWPETAATNLAAPPHGPAGAAVALPGDEEEEERGWRVRRPGEAHAQRAVPAAKAEEDPFEGNAKMTETRRRIEDRLRRKRCDEAAALLQALALETGGRHVAELAMNAGDRCRALGKSNAALNCYLAASRSDPVYELPLSRLADICIDDKETDLAVSYLERIARLYRFRGDEIAALRVYRRIATIAPYREDVLTLLMNAQRTGRLEA